MRWHEAKLIRIVIVMLVTGQMNMGDKTSSRGRARGGGIYPSLIEHPPPVPVTHPNVQNLAHNEGMRLAGCSGSVEVMSWSGLSTTVVSAIAKRVVFFFFLCQKRNRYAAIRNDNNCLNELFVSLSRKKKKYNNSSLSSLCCRYRVRELVAPLNLVHLNFFFSLACPSMRENDELSCDR